MDGFYADTTQACRRFFKCSGGKIVGVENCPHGYLHDGKNCQPQELVNCEQPKSTAISYPFNNDNRCYGVVSGTNAVDDVFCKSYVTCDSGRVVNMLNCHDGYLYDRQQKRCVSEHETVCQSNNMDDSEICRYLVDGLHADPLSIDCKNYLKCYNKKLVSKHRCPLPTIFNGTTCIPDTLYECPKSVRLDKMCKGKYDGFHVDPRMGCSNYMKCIREYAVEFYQCSKGQIFDQESKSCIYKTSKSTCNYVGTSSDCMYSESGYYQDRSIESSCREYYFCYNGKKTSFRCDLGKVFNGENCVDERLYSCLNLDENSCDNKPDGYYKDKSGCRAYFYCSGGRKYSYVCGDGQAFDGSKCVEKRHVSQCAVSLDCSGKSDGYYQDVPSNCRNYYYCLQGDKIQLLTCRNGRVFNGQGCVSKTSYTCPSYGSRKAEVANCLPRKCKICPNNGFFADLDSGCRNYYFCIEGKSTPLSCSSNFVFNGEICVPSDTYKCPQYCSDKCSD